MDLFTDEYFMNRAIAEAVAAFEEDEVPIGAVVVLGNKIIGRGYNQTEKLKDITAHAEMLAITSASTYLNSKYLDECTIYITIEPCVMCAGAINNSRIGKVVFGAPEPKTGFSNHLSAGNQYMRKAELVGGILQEECSLLMKEFFSKKREK